MDLHAYKPGSALLLCIPPETLPECRENLLPRLSTMSKGTVNAKGTSKSKGKKQAVKGKARKEQPRTKGAINKEVPQSRRTSVRLEKKKAAKAAKATHARRPVKPEVIVNIRESL